MATLFLDWGLNYVFLDCVLVLALKDFQCYAESRPTHADTSYYCIYIFYCDRGERFSLS